MVRGWNRSAGSVGGGHLGDGDRHALWPQSAIDRVRPASTRRHFRWGEPRRDDRESRRCAVHRRRSGARALARSIHRGGTGRIGWRNGRFRAWSNPADSALVRRMRKTDRATHAQLWQPDTAHRRAPRLRQRCRQRVMLGCGSPGNFTSIVRQERTRCNDGYAAHD